MLIKRAYFFTMIAELASVGENVDFPKHWSALLKECTELVKQCKQWMDSVDEDVRAEVMTQPKARELIMSMVGTGNLM